ncbi:hypothetical protein FRC00_001534 [Tulasnella sp. 408]|nr:hypothetical protein FRC00_001534 [Tulasnella sp. 408]
MFGKILPTRRAATSPTPQFQLGPTSQSAPKRPSLLVKKLIRIKNVFSRSSSANKGLNGLTHDDQGRFDRRRYRASSDEPTRSALSPRFHSGQQGSTLRTAPRSAPSANNSPLLLPPQPATTTPATSFPPTNASSQRSTSRNAPRPGSTLRTAPRSAPSANNSPLLLPPQPATTTPATSFPPTNASSQRSTSRNAPRPTSSSKSQRRPVVTTRATTFAPRSTQPTTRPIFPVDAPPLMALAHSIVTNPATDLSPLSASFLRSTPTKGVSSASSMIADLEQTAANLDRQYNECVESVRATMEDHIFPYTQSIVSEAKLAKNRLEELEKQLAAVDQACSQLEARCNDECEKIGQAEAALKKVHCDVQEADKKYTALQVELREMQLGQGAYQGWQKLYDDALQRDAQRVEEKQGGSSTSLKSFQQVKKAITSWNSQWDSMIARQRYSVPRPVQAAAKPEAQQSGNGDDGRLGTPNPSGWMQQGGSPGVDKKGPAAMTPQVGTAAAPTEPRQHTENRRAHVARQAHTSNDNGGQLLRGQLAPNSLVHARRWTARSRNSV